jgi:hypothetical protein
MEGLKGRRLNAAPSQEPVGNVGAYEGKVVGYPGHQVGIVGIIHTQHNCHYSCCQQQPHPL